MLKLHKAGMLITTQSRQVDYHTRQVEYNPEWGMTTENDNIKAMSNVSSWLNSRSCILDKTSELSGIAVYTCNASSQEAGSEGLVQGHVLDYTVSLRPPWVIWHPLSNKQKENNQPQKWCYVFDRHITQGDR